MTDTPDLNDLAKRYIDLWQEHLTDLAADGQVADTIARTIELMSGSASAVAAFNQQMAAGGQGVTSDAKYATPGNAAPPSGSPAVAPAHGDAKPDVDELVSRIAELEKRLDQMESKTRRAGRKPAKKTA